jgi:D-3-phosphoglycerate dehydrogenase
VDQQALGEAIKNAAFERASTCSRSSRRVRLPQLKDAIRERGGLYGTHHIGASTDQAQEAIAAETVRIVQEFKKHGKVPNVVNLAQRTPATHRLVVRHLDRPGVLAGVLEALKAEQINVQEMENIVFEGAAAAGGAHQSR